MMTYVDEHERCATCGGETQFNIDLNENGRAVANPEGDTIKCQSCGDFICGGCVSPDEPTFCRSCVACDACYKYVSDTDCVRVKRGGYKAVLHCSHERICKACQGERVIEDTLAHLSRAKFVTEATVRKMIAQDTIRILEEFFA